MTSEGEQGNDQERNRAHEEHAAATARAAAQAVDEAVRRIANTSRKAGVGEEAAASEEVERIASERVKLTVLLPEREMAILRRLAAKRDISLTDAVRRAIAMEQFIDDIEAERGKLLCELPDRTIRQIVVR